MTFYIYITREVPHTIPRFERGHRLISFTNSLILPFLVITGTTIATHVIQNPESF